MTTIEKPRFPAALALSVAYALVADLRPHCIEGRIVIAGSLRRRKADVGDIEIVFVPRESPAPAVDLFAPPPMLAATDAAITELLARGILAKRTNAIGRESWGLKNKLAKHVASGIPVDLFTATESNWWNYLVCRTGGAETNVAICTAAIRKGWKWTPYGDGFSKPKGLGREVIPVADEREVFDLVEMPYLEPWERR